ncbi:MAG: hypothetical protein KIT09_10335 [Bryobacteraceae bacterium]|nr:hypothetical protein [Bryobacteraceae bacterium]
MPAKSPNWNAVAERWVRSVKSEVLSKLILIDNSPQAARELARLANHDRDQVEEAIERFAQTGVGDVKMLKAEGRQRRLRVGDCHADKQRRRF